MTTPIPLDPFLYQIPLWCVDCGGEKTFVEVCEFEGGREGYCLGCGKRSVIAFQRTVGR